MMEKEYIIPKNYKIEAKLFGILDYKAGIYYVIFCSALTYLISAFVQDIFIRFKIIIAIALPVLLIIVNGFNGENISYIIKYLLRYIFKKKRYVYERDNN